MSVGQIVTTVGLSALGATTGVVFKTVFGNPIERLIHGPPLPPPRQKIKIITTARHVRDIQNYKKTIHDLKTRLRDC